jgi:subtilisin family serine protease
MKRATQVLSVVLVVAASVPGWAQTRYILRPTSQAVLVNVTAKFQLTTVEPIDGARSVWVVTAASSRPPQEVEKEVSADTAEVTDIELDQATGVPEVSQSTAAILDQLPAPSTITYYGSNVLGFYTTQPAVGLIRLPDAQTTFKTLGAGVVAIIDTGIDPTHPVLSASIVSGYDFVNNIAGSASEWIDLTKYNKTVLQNSSPLVTSKNTVAFVSQSTAAILDQSTAAILDYKHMPKAFGHGTMVAGVVHLVAPKAQIMPLKAFRGDGTANLSDILRAVYYAADHGAHVINMSFTLTVASPELADAIDYAEGMNAICVAAAGNNSKTKVENPANLPYVMGIASTTNKDQRSSFTSYGAGVFEGAPGEGIVTTYPGQNYAEATGTSFSSPLVAGAAALTVQVNPTIDFTDSSAALGNAKQISSNGVGHGRLDVYAAIQALLNQP